MGFRHLTTTQMLMNITVGKGSVMFPESGHVGVLFCHLVSNLLYGFCCSGGEEGDWTPCRAGETGRERERASHQDHCSSSPQQQTTSRETGQATVMTDGHSCIYFWLCPSFKENNKKRKKNSHCSCQYHLLLILAYMWASWPSSWCPFSLWQGTLKVHMGQVQPYLTEHG